MTNPTLLKVNDLQIGFRSGRGYQSAVKSVSFELRQGQTLAIVGESGSGKSVSSLSLMSLLQKGKAVFENGVFHFDNHVFAEFFSPQKSQQDFSFTPSDEQLKLLRGKGIAMIFQEPMTSLNPVMTCGKQVAEMLGLHKKMDAAKAKKRTIELFEEVRLPRPQAIFDQYPHQLSGGQRQRVMIAMAISCDPKILIADEPTTALDVTVQRGILELLKSLQVRHQMGMIFITHDLGVVAEIADHVVVMRKGVIVEHGSANEIFHHPQHPYTKGLIACSPDPARKSDRLKTVDDFMSADDKEIKSVPRNEVEKGKNAVLEAINVSKIYHDAGKIFGKKK